MLSRASLFALAATAAFGSAFPWSRSMTKVNYKIPESMMKLMAQDDSCILPASFDITGFLIWAPDPASNNTNSPIITFTYTDKSTDINTNCFYNNTSPNVGSDGLVPRYACDDEIVQFIWDTNSTTLTIVEKACPESGGTLEASGVVNPDLTCLRTKADSWEGAGTACYSKVDDISGVFTSLGPPPPSVASY